MSEGGRGVRAACCWHGLHSPWQASRREVGLGRAVVRNVLGLTTLILASFGVKLLLLWRGQYLDSFCYFFFVICSFSE